MRDHRNEVIENHGLFWLESKKALSERFLSAKLVPSTQMRWQLRACGVFGQIVVGTAPCWGLNLSLYLAPVFCIMKIITYR